MPNPLSDELAALLTETVGFIRDRRELAKETTTLVRLVNKVIGDLVNPPDTTPPDPPGPLRYLRKEQIMADTFRYFFAPAAPVNPADVVERRIVLTRFAEDGTQAPDEFLPVALDAAEISIDGVAGTRFVAGLSDKDASDNWSPIADADKYDTGTIIDDVPPASPGLLTLIRKEQVAPVVEPPVEEPPVEEPPVENPPTEPAA